jgi:hypothetical protein
MEQSSSSLERYFVPGDVIYAPGWDYCYQVVSGPFCRIHYVRWRGSLVANPSDARRYVGYLTKVLGGNTLTQLFVKATSLLGDRQPGL